MTRTATIERTTKETRITLKLNLDGKGIVSAKTGVGFLDHMLDHLGRHSLCDLEISASGDLHVDDHHTVEDVAICLGQALKQALGDKAGVARYGWASVPMEDALANVAIDLSGRAAVVFNVQFTSDKIGRFDTQLIDEFFRRLSAVAGINLHINVPYGGNDHHVAEAVFKAFALSLRQAKAVDTSLDGTVPSTKGIL